MAGTSVLWPIFFSSLIIAWLYEKLSVYEYNEIGEKVYIRKDKFFFALLVISMSTFVGLRIWCNDTGEYRDVYEYLTPSSGNIFDNMEWSLGDNPGYILINRIIKHFGASSQTFLMIMSFFTNGIYIWFIRKHSSDFWLSFFLFWTMGVYLFTAAAIKQTTAVALAILGIDRYLENKKFRFVIWILLASTIHPYALMFLIAPLFLYSPWTNKTYYCLAAFGIAGIALQPMLGTLISITSMMGEEYDVSMFTGEGVNVFRLLVVWAPVILSIMVKKRMRLSQDKKRNLFMNFAMLNATIMFVALFGTANYFARLANYFLIFQTLALPWILQCFNIHDKRVLKIVVVSCYMLYFIFAHVVLTPFNTYFAKMSLMDYLKTLF